MTGTGPEGRIRGVDIDNFVPSAAPAPSMAAPSAPAAAPGALYTDLPTSNIRQVCAPITLMLAFASFMTFLLIIMCHEL